jgi:hypothetical protein
MWRIRLVYKDGGLPRYFGGDYGVLTADTRHAATYSTEQGAQDAADKLATHPWGPWRVESTESGE